MMPVIPCSVSNVSLIPVNAFTTRKSRCYTRYTYPGSPTKHSLPSQRYYLTLPQITTVLPRLSKACTSRRTSSRVLATGTDVAVEEPESLVADETSAPSPEDAETKEDPSAKSDVNTPVRVKRRQGRKSEMPLVKNEELVPGATFTGKVRSIQPFGAFVDFGAFTDGLVHVSRLSDNFVKDVNDVVSLGQEVKVRLVEVNTETGRISLSMRDGESGNRPQQKSDSSDSARPPRKNANKPGQKREEFKKTSKFVKGQDVVGTVKNFARSGAFISLPEDEEGFLPTSEEPDDGFGNVMGNTSLEVGQEVKVRVLRISRGIVTLTMKTEEDVQKLDSKLSQGVIHTATNPFVVAFRRNKDIATFLDEREKSEEPAEISSELVSAEEAETVEQSNLPETSEVQADQETSSEINGSFTNPVDNIVKEQDESLSTENVVDRTAGEDASAETTNNDDSEESSVGEISQSLDSAATIPTEEPEANSEVIDSELTPMVDDPNAEKSEDEVVKSQIKAPVDEVAMPIPDTSEAVDGPNAEQSEEEVVTSQIEAPVAVDEVATPIPGTSEALDGPNAEQSEEEAVTNQTEAPVAVDEVATPIPDTSEEVVAQTVDVSSKEDVPAEVSANDATVETSTPEANGNVTGSNGSSPQGSASKAAISPALVKQLREETGAGMMDCKKALSETGGDIAKAQEYLRKKGLASADKKSSRTTAEGRIGSYIHDGRIGILVEVNCETDFVSRGDIFRELVEDLAMQVAACPQVEYLSTEDVPKEIVEKEKEIEMQKEDLLSKPEQIRSKIVEGKVSKRLGDLALLEQQYIKDDKVAVKDWVKQTIATIGENIKVKRFVRYNLGEGLQKKSQDFAAEVAAQTAAKPAPAPEKEQSAAVDVEKPVEKAPSVAVSAALVKQLREETGAGMMDCKKALSETGGDLEKAQEYLRKKGLSSADKKSSRLAAEGRIGSYVHDARIGVLIEVNCETDFVGRSENFKEFADDLAMQVAACPQVQYVSVEDIPESIKSKEKELEMQREDILSKPENIRERIVEGRISKRLGELALLEQPYIKDDSISVKDLVKQTVAVLGENIKVRRFARFTLGEQTESTNLESETE